MIKTNSMIKLIKSVFYKEAKTKKALCKFIGNAKQLSIGQECYSFEKNFARWQKRKYCVFFNSGSSANLAIIQTLLNLGQIKKNDSVGFSAITWATNPMPLIQLGLNALPIDVELDTLNVSSNKLIDFLKKNNIKMFFLTNLDSENSHHILQTMKKLNKELDTTFIFATHDEKVMKYLDRKISLADGMVVKDELLSQY